jgi:hypothetical protein
MNENGTGAAEARSLLKGLVFDLTSNWVRVNPKYLNILVEGP